METRETKETQKKLFNKVINEIQSFVFNTTNLIDDLSTTETAREKEKVENKLLTILRKETINE
tara:strand:+ start:575 stop:763 length:189 start_codon:yes stop_codon:yes gene_type:complete